MSQKFDIIIPGARNAGSGVSQIAEAAGKSIAFVESGDFFVSLLEASVLGGEFGE